MLPSFDIFKLAGVPHLHTSQQALQGHQQQQNDEEMLPDDPAVKIMSAIMLAVYLIGFFILILLLIMRRKQKVILVRNPTLLIISLGFSFYIIVCTLLRFIIGREIFPCNIYLLMFHVTQPGFCVPTILRCWRLFFIYKVNHFKNVYAIYYTVEGESHHDINNTHAGSKHMGISGSTRGVDGNGSTAISDGSSSSSGGSGGNTGVVDGVIGNDGDDDMGQSRETEYYMFENDTKNSFRKMKVHVLNVSVNTSEEEIAARLKEKTKGKEYNIVDTKFVEKLKRLTLLISPKLFVLVVLTLVVFHALIFLIICAINPSKYFVYSTGCGVDNLNFIIAVIIILFYLALETVGIIMIIGVKDEWKIRREIFMLAGSWIFWVFIFCLFQLLHTFAVLQADHYFPYGYALLAACAIDNFISCFIPVLYSFEAYTGGTQQMLESDLSIVLNDTQLRGKFLNFCIECFAPEPIIFWEAVQKYKNAKKNRWSVASGIISKFLEDNSDLQLNINSRKKVCQKLTEKIQSSKRPEDLDPKLFDQIVNVAEKDMLSLFPKFCEKLEIKLALQKRKDQILLDSQIL